MTTTTNVLRMDRYYATVSIVVALAPTNTRYNSSGAKMPEAADMAAGVMDVTTMYVSKEGVTIRGNTYLNVAQFTTELYAHNAAASITNVDYTVIEYATEDNDTPEDH